MGELRGTDPSQGLLKVYFPPRLAVGQFSCLTVFFSFHVSIRVTESGFF